MDFLKMDDISASQLSGILALSAKLKAGTGKGEGKRLLVNKTLLMLFAKNSTRTRVSFEVAMTQLGGHAIFLALADSQGSRGETLSDTGAVAGGMVDFLMARVAAHFDLEELAKGSEAPVINGLSDLEHPCQALADLLTLQELGKLGKGKKVAFVGDCQNNVANSLIVACAMSGTEIALSGPRDFAPNKQYMAKAAEIGGRAEYFAEPQQAASGADAIYTDTWISMGMEKEAASRMEKFAPYQVDSALMKKANKGAVFMHCLPAHRGEEVSAGVIDGKSSVVLRQANNRLHAQKGLLVWLDSIREKSL